jgi:antitoxin VapB
MMLTVLSEEVDQLAEALAARKHVDKVAAVKLALENELRRGDEALSLRERIRPIQDRIMARPPTGLEADKAFYDELSGDI